MTELQQKLQCIIEVTLDNFESVIISALEGGSNYWYYLPNKLPSKLPIQCNGKSYSEKIAYLLFNDPTFKLQVNDVENEADLLGYCTQESMLAAFGSCPRDFTAILSEDYDSYNADSIFQTSVMGEVIYG
jgi:hypothetical protein